jgi:hypothetical protein
MESSMASAADLYNQLKRRLEESASARSWRAPSFAFRLSRPNEPHSFGLSAGLFRSIEASRTNRVISPCYLDISPSAAAQRTGHLVS